MKNQSVIVKFSFLFGLFVGFVHASGSYGVVTALEGRAFGVHDEKTFALKVGYKLPQKTDIITEEGVQVSFIDFHNRKYHLSGAAHVQIRDHILKLNRGYLWVKSFQRDTRLVIKTANSLTEFLSGEGILSFDNTNGRSQLLAIKGELRFAHILDVNRYEVLQPGEFSSIDYENGTPPRGTLIGFESYEKIISLFRNSRMADAKNSKVVIKASRKKKSQKKLVKNNKKLKRSLAISGHSRSKGGSIPALKTKWTTHQIKNLNSDLKDLYSGQLGKTAQSSKREKTKKGQDYSWVRIRVFGGRRRVLASAPPSLDQGDKSMVKLKRTQRRAPATLNESNSSSWGVERSLRRYLRKTSRHKLESDGLIEGLKSYRRDYKLNY